MADPYSGDTSSKVDDEAAARRFRRLGYFECKRVLTTIRDFQDLVYYHHSLGASNDERASKPLQEIINNLPSEEKYYERQAAIETQISKRLPRVFDILTTAGIPTQIQWPEHDFEEGKLKSKIVDLDLVGNYFAYVQPDSAHYYENRRALLRLLDSAAGVYEHARDRAVRRWFHPATWLGAILRFPLSVIQAAHLDSGESANLLIKAYAWTLRLLMLAVVVLLIALLAKALGIQIPWDKFITLFK